MREYMTITTNNFFKSKNESEKKKNLNNSIIYIIKLNENQNRKNQ